MMKTSRHFNKLNEKRGLLLRITFIISIAFVLWAFTWEIKAPDPSVRTIIDLEEFPSIYATNIVQEEKEIPIAEERRKDPVVEIKETRKEEKIVKEEKNVEQKNKTSEVTFNLKDIPVDSSKLSTREKPRRVADQMPEFPGGTDALIAFVQQRVKYCALALEIRIEGTVFVDFVIDKKGKVTNVSLTRGIMDCLDKEVLRVAAQIPDWKPGRMNGRPVDVLMTMPVSFKLEPADR